MKHYYSHFSLLTRCRRMIRGLTEERGEMHGFFHFGFRIVLFLFLLHRGGGVGGGGSRHVGLGDGSLKMGVKSEREGKPTV